jgi:hypothetical protein
MKEGETGYFGKADVKSVINDCSEKNQLNVILMR